MLNLTEEEQQKIGYLQDLANKYGDFRITYLQRKENGELIRTKWKSVLECWETEEGLKFLAKANNREPLPIEVFIDIDTQIKAEQKMNKICDWLEQNNEKYIAYFSGSKGYHIHVLLTTNYDDKTIKLIENKNYRQDLRTKFLDWLKSQGADILKFSDGHMVAIENTPHWKTGKTKTRVRGTWEIL